MIRRRTTLRPRQPRGAAAELDAELDDSARAENEQAAGGRDDVPLATRARRLAETVRDRVHDAIEGRRGADDAASQAIAVAQREVARALAAVEQTLARATDEATRAHQRAMTETDRVRRAAITAADEASAEAERAHRHVGRSDDRRN